MLNVCIKLVSDKWFLQSYAYPKNRRPNKASSVTVLPSRSIAGRQCSQYSASVTLEYTGGKGEGHREGLISFSKFVIAQGHLE